jgi:hypothetical protein
MLMGPIAAGKSTFAEHLGRMNPKYRRVLKTSSLLTGTRIARQRQGDRLEETTQGRWVLDAINKMKPTRTSPVIVDAVRSVAQINQVRTAHKSDCLLVGIRSSSMQEHILSRKLDLEATRELVAAMRHPLEQNLPWEMCDVIFDNTRFTIEQLF